MAGPLWFLPALAISHIGYKIVNSCAKEALKNILLSVIILLAAQILSVLFKKHLTFVGGGIKLIYYPVATVLRGLSYIFFVALGVQCKKVFIKLDNDVETGHFKGKIICIVMVLAICANILCAYFYNDVKTLADLNSKDLLFIPIMIVVAITGSASIIGFAVIISKIKGLLKLFTFFGKNSLFIMVTHLQFYICAVSRRINILNLNNLLTRFLFVIAVEVILIIILNKPFNKVIEYIAKKLNKFLGEK